MRLKMEIEMEEASFVSVSSTPCPLLLARGGGFNRSAHSAGPFLVPSAWYISSWLPFGRSWGRPWGSWASLGPGASLGFSGWSLGGS